MRQSKKEYNIRGINRHKSSAKGRQSCVKTNIERKECLLTGKFLCWNIDIE